MHTKLGKNLAIFAYKKHFINGVCESATVVGGRLLLFIL